MAAAIGIGHNLRGRGSMYAIVFGFDTEMRKQTDPTQSWNHAYNDVRSYLAALGFKWK